MSHCPRRSVPLGLGSGLFALLLAAGCEAPTAPLEPADADAAFSRVEILQAPTGNPRVHFLPPLAPAVSPTGSFDGALPLEVFVYEGAAPPCPEGTADSGGCPVLLASFTTGGRGPSAIRVDHDDEHYIVNWTVGRGDGGPYRIVARAEGVLLDYVVLATAQGTLPIRIRIEEGAQAITTQPISEEGGEVRSTDGRVTLEVPEGAVATEETFTIQPLAPESGTDDRVIDGTKYRFGPAGTEFAEPVRITLTFDPGSLPTGLGASRLRLHRLVGSTWQLIPGSTVDLETSTVTGEVRHFSVFAALPAAFEQVDTGELHACGLTADGSAWCWGLNTQGQLGAPSEEVCAVSSAGTGGPCSTTAVEVEGGLKFEQVSTGLDHTCGVTAAGEIFCWGGNARGQLGNGSSADSPSPVQVASTETFVEVNVQNNVSCGRTAAGVLLCWGRNDRGELGSPTSETCLGAACSTTPIPVPIPGSVTQVSVGLVHVCAVTSGGAAYCWGQNFGGQLGTGDASPSAGVPPTQVLGGPWQRISSGAVHTCGIASGGQGFCWGQSFGFGALGDGSTTNSASPLPVTGGLAFRSLEASNGNYVFLHSCGVTTDFQAYCWGANLDGALGVGLAPETCSFFAVGDFDCAFAPIAVSGGLSFDSVSLGRGFTCGITTDGETYCWGLNSQGQLGNGSTTGSRVPTRVATGS